jgi:phosphate starvation-inducible PhoH-like protein
MDRIKKTDVKFSAVLTDEQREAKEQIKAGTFVFLLGKPGTSKTFLACAVGLDLLFKKEIEKIVITRPTISTEDNGFLPGTLEEKMEPWLVPIRSNMRTIYNNPTKLKKLEDDKEIEIVSLSHFRGRTFANSLCIVDEFENMTSSQLRMAIGRLGKDSIMIFCGDESQIDLKQKTTSAIYELNKIKNSKFVKIITLTENHRHPAVEQVLEMLGA